MRNMNRFEVDGVLGFLDVNSGWDIAPLKSYVAGTRENGILNLVNVRVHANFPDGYPYLGGIGLTEGEDIILEFWDEEEMDRIHVWTPYVSMLCDSDFRNSYEEYDVKKGELVKFLNK